MIKKQAPGENILKVGGMLLLFLGGNAGIWQRKHTFPGNKRQR